MPKLTRTQKFADLREQLAHDKEENITTQDLTSFEDRFNYVQNILSPEKVVEENHFIENPGLENKTQDDEWVPFDAIDDTLNDLSNTIQAFEQLQEVPEVEEEVESKPVSFEVEENVEQPADETVSEELPTFEEPQEELVAENTETTTPSYFDSFMEEKADDKPENAFVSYFDLPKQEETEEQLPEMEDTQQGLSIDEIYSDVFKDVSDESGEIVSVKERNTYLNQTFSDVNAYITDNGEQTINQLIDNSVDEIRHPESKEEAPAIEVLKEVPVDDVFKAETESEEAEKPENNSIDFGQIKTINNEFGAPEAWTPFSETSDNEFNSNEFGSPIIKDDTDFSNTVSLEISKIMNEVNNAPKAEEIVEEISTDELAQEPIVETPSKLENEEETIQVASEELLEEKHEEVVEIKNISEIKEEIIRETMSTTIPFVVANDGEELLDEEDEDGSNTVLNVILIVLIVVLIAVLGLIVFYILKTKGIF